MFLLFVLKWIFIEIWGLNVGKGLSYLLFILLVVYFEVVLEISVFLRWFFLIIMYILLKVFNKLN